MKYNKIALIGMMGSGKSSIVKELSNTFNIKTFDLDNLFEEKYQLSIKDFFEKYSEEQFRKLESELLKEISKQDSFVLSTGGGIILSEENRNIIFNKDIFSVYLSTTPDTIYERIKNDTTRPLLLVKNPKQEIEKILNQRIDYYKMANLTIDTDDKTIKEIVKELKWLI